MEEGASIGAVVQTIMESLSEAISQLMLYVIAMQESNSVMPAHIPTAAQGVTDASNTLADVASSIAEDEYEGYPDIQIPIINAAKDVRASGVNLTASVNNLKTASNKAEGWARLQDACGIISAQTCYILQLVYAAELKRMMFATEAAKDLAGQTQAALAAKDPQKFADQVSEMAGHADALADSLSEKIKEEESPLRKEELKKQAAQLKRIAEELPKLANDLLRDPKNVQAQKAYNDKVKEFEKLLDDISKPFESKLALLPDKPPQIAPTPIPSSNPPPFSPPPAQKRQTDPPPSRPGPTPHQQANAPPRGGNPPPPNNPPRGDHVPPPQHAAPHNTPPYHPAPQSHAPPPPTVIPQAAQKAKDDLKNMISAAGAKNTPSVVHESQKLAADVSPVVEALEHLAKQSKDPERVAQLQKTAEEVKKFTPKAVTLAAATLKDPKSNSPELQKMVQKLDTLMDFAQEVAKPAPDVELAAIAKGLLEQLPKLTSAPAPGVQKEKQVEETAKKIDDLLPFLAPAAKDFLNNKLNNPHAKARLTEALKAAEGAIPESVGNARASAKNAKDVPTLDKAKKSAGVAEQALKDILKACGADVLAHTRKQKDDVAMLDVMATMEQPKQVAAVEKEIAKRHPHLADRALELANNSPGTSNIAQEVKKIDEILPEQIHAAHEVVNKPNADPPKKKLKQNTQEMAKALDNITAEVQNAAPPTTSTNLPSMQELLDALQAAKDPKNENKLQSLLDKLAPALEKMLESLPEDDPEQQAAEKIVALGQDLQDTIDQIVKNAPASNNPKDIEKLIKDLPKKGQDFIEAVKPFVEKFIEDPEVKALLKDALDDLAALLPEIITTATDVAKNPRDPRPRKKLDDLGNAGNKNVNFVIKKINRPPEEKKEEAKRRFPKAVKNVLDAIDKPNELAGALDRLKKVVRDMNPPSSDPTPDYLGNRKIADAIKELEKALEEKQKKPPSAAGEKPAKPFEDAKKFFENLLDPKNTPKSDPKDEVIAKVKDVENLLDRLEAAALAPNTDPAKLANIVKAIGTKVPPLLQAAKKAAEGVKDPQLKKKLDEALKKLETELPRLINEGVKPVLADPTPENKEKLKDIISDFRAPLDNIAAAVAPDPEVDLGKQEKQEAAKLAKAAKNSDPKAAQDALKAIKDFNNKFVRAAKEKAAQAPPQLKDHIEQKVKELEEKVKAIEPVALEFAKKPNDTALKENLAALANNLAGPIDSVIEDLRFAPQATQHEQQEMAKQILASIKAKNIKKLDPSHLLKISKHLAGLLSDMVSKTGDELHSQNQSGMSERARAALELEKLLSGLERDAAKSSGNTDNYAQSIDALLSSLNLSVSGGGQAGASSSSSAGAGPQTQLTQQVSAVVKQIRTKTTGSIEGTPLHTISQSLAADLQKFADADSGNSRSELIVLGRTISASIVRLADELKRLAAACTDPKMQEKLLMNAQVLRNYSTQLKIMASVRAAAPKHGNDSSSDQLVILTQNLAAVIGDATNVVSIMKQTKKGNV